MSPDWLNAEQAKHRIYKKIRCFACISDVMPAEDCGGQSQGSQFLAAHQADEGELDPLFITFLEALL